MYFKKIFILTTPKDKKSIKKSPERKIFVTTIENKDNKKTQKNDYVSQRDFDSLNIRAHTNAWELAFNLINIISEDKYTKNNIPETQIYSKMGGRRNLQFEYKCLAWL